MYTDLGSLTDVFVWVARDREIRERVTFDGCAGEKEVSEGWRAMDWLRGGPKR